MAILTKDALLSASDLREEELYLPSIGGSVRVRSLSAAYSNDALSKATSVENVRGEAVAKFSAAKLEELKVLHGMIEPKLDTAEEAHQFASRVGPAWKQIVSRIDELSGLNPDAMAETQQTFRLSGASPSGASPGNGTPAGSGGSDLHVRAGARVEDASG